MDSEIIKLIVKLVLLFLGIGIVCYTLLNPTFWEEIRNARFRDKHNDKNGRNI